ncbi:MAG: glycosyltransferase family 4 protein [Patescibacteria group bacterium]
MKVAVIIDTWFPFVGGGQINAWEISKRLAHKGQDVEIITRNCGKDSLQSIKNLKVAKLGPKSKTGNNFSKIIFIFRAFFYVHKRDFDLVHAHAFFPGITARLVTVFKGTPSIFTVHGTSLNTKLNGLASRLVENFILTKILYSAQITVSRDFYKIKNVNKNIIFIPNGAYIKNYNSNTQKENLLCAARLHPQKNLDNLIKAFKIIERKYPHIKLQIAGDGPQKKYLQELVKNLNLNNKVKFLGLLDKKSLNKLYSTSKLFILSSVYEGQPLTVLEAFAAKLPVVVTRTGDLPYIVKEGVNGFFISDPLNPRSIATSIIKALNNNNLGKLGNNGFNLVKNNYTWDKIGQKTYELYRQTIKN